MKPRFTSWDDVPIVLDIEDCARVLGRSVTSIRRELRAGTMVPAPMPKVGKTTPYQWVKRDLVEHLDERGYRKHDARGARRQRLQWAAE